MFLLAHGGRCMGRVQTAGARLVSLRNSCKSLIDIEVFVRGDIMDRQMLRRLRIRALEEREAARHSPNARSAASHQELARRYDDVIAAYATLGLS